MGNIPKEGGRRGALSIPQVLPLTAAVMVLAGILSAPAAATKSQGPPAEKPPATTTVKKSSGKDKPAPAASRKSTRKSGAGARQKKAATKTPSPKAAAARKPPAAMPASPAPSAAGGIQRLSFPVKGMVCMLCTRGVEEAIKRLPGVATVTADLGKGRVEVVALEHRSLDIQQVRERAGRAGFPVSGEVDVEAAGRFEIGADRRLTFRTFGGGYAWQVLESARLLALTRAHPGLRGQFILGFRVHEKPLWKRPSISITTFESAAPVQRAADGA